MNFDALLDRLGRDDSLLSDSVVRAAEAAYAAQHKTEATAYEYGLAAVAALPAMSTPFEKGLALGLSIMLATER